MFVFSQKAYDSSKGPPKHRATVHILGDLSAWQMIIFELDPPLPHQGIFALASGIRRQPFENPPHPFHSEVIRQPIERFICCEGARVHFLASQSY